MLVTVLSLMVSSLAVVYSTVTNDTAGNQDSLKLADSTYGKDSKSDASFYFTNVGPHGFEYRAVLDHGDDPFNLRKHFGPFFNGLPRFPHLQNNLPPSGELFAKVTPATKSSPIYPILPDIHNHHPTNHPIIQGKQHGFPLDEFYRRKDVSPPPVPRHKLNAEDFPKIFKFNDERINIIDFDRDKKYGKNHDALTRGDYLDPEKILRNKFLILHGGVFKLEKGPLEYQTVLNKGNFQKHTQYY